MKILQIAPLWLDTPADGYGGTEAVIANLCNGLVAEGHEVTLFATGKSKTKAKTKYVFKTSLRDQNIDWKYALPAYLHYNEAFKLAQKEKFDIIHVHLSSGTDILGLGYMADCKIPSVMTIHGHFPYDRTSNMDEYFLKFYAKNIPVVNISKVMETLTPKEFYKAGVVYNSVDHKAYKPNYKFNEKGYLTWLGKIITSKGLYEAILATKKANERLIFAGVVEETVQESVDYFEKIKPLIDGDQIKYIGPANFAMKNKLLKNAKGFLNPISWEEPFGMVMAESMVCGTPVISYARGAAKELIADGVSGYLIAESVDALVEKIGELNKLDRRLVRKHAIDNFSVNSMTSKYLKIYEKVIYIEKNESKTMTDKLKSKITMLNSKLQLKDK